MAYFIKSVSLNVLARVEIYMRAMSRRFSALDNEFYELHTFIYFTRRSQFKKNATQNAETPLITLHPPPS